MNLINFKHRKTLIKYNHREDFGHDWYVQILNIKRWSLLQVSVSWNDYPSWPYLQIKSGTGDVLDFLFWVYKFGIDVTLIGRTWSWDYLDEIDEEGEDNEGISR
jgi:hypothetical protein